MDNGIALKPIAQQRIVITGASSGIGLAIAEAAVAAGARVMLAARNGEALADIRDRLTAAGDDVAILAVDIARPGAAGELVDAAVARFGGWDTWVNNASVATHGPVLETSIDEHRRVFDVGYWGVVNGARPLPLIWLSVLVCTALGMGALSASRTIGASLPVRAFEPR